MPPTRHSMTEMHRSTNDTTGANIASGKVATADGSGGVIWDDAGSGGLPWFNVMDYGAVGDNSTDDRSDINDAITALNAAGRGVLYFPASAGYYVSNSLTAITVPALILGDGGGSVGESTSMIRTDHASAFLFTLSNYNITVRGLRLYNSNGSETDGAAIQTSTGFGSWNSYENLWVEGFRDGLSLQHGGEWSMVNCHVTNPVRYGVNIANTDLPDGGDWSLVNCWFGLRNRNATNAINVASAGGGKLVNVKINCNSAADQGGGTGVKRYVDGINVNINGAANNTSVFTVSSCSIENVSGDAIDISTTGTGRFGMVAISALEVALFTNNTGRAVKITAASAGGIGTNGGIGGVVIDSMAARTDGTARAAVELTNTDSVTLGDFTLIGFDARYTSSGDTNTIDQTALDYGEDGDISTLDFGDVPDAGVLNEVARADHVHGMPDAPSGSVPPAILLESGHAVPFTFDEILQESDGSDFLWASE